MLFHSCPPCPSSIPAPCIPLFILTFPQFPRRLPSFFNLQEIGCKQFIPSFLFHLRFCLFCSRPSLSPLAFCFLLRNTRNLAHFFNNLYANETIESQGRRARDI